MSPYPVPPRKKPIQLPRSSTRAQKAWAHLKLLTDVRTAQYSMAFEGRILAPGALLDPELLPVPAVVIECVGPVGEGRGHRRREILWIPLAGEIMNEIDHRVEHEIDPVRANALNAVYDQVAGRLAAL